MQANAVQISGLPLLPGLKQKAVTAVVFAEYPGTCPVTGLILGRGENELSGRVVLLDTTPGIPGDRWGTCLSFVLIGSREQNSLVARSSVCARLHLYGEMTFILIPWTGFQIIPVIETRPTKPQNHAFQALPHPLCDRFCSRSSCPKSSRCPRSVFLFYELDLQDTT